MKKEVKIAFKTLTPLWTGDAEGKSEKLKLTGIIGSLRWWFEALVRGMGYYACDSTSDNKCKVEIKNPGDIGKIHEKMCPVCFLFGATGWKSRFSLNIENDNLKKPYDGKVVVKLNDGNGWHYEAGLMGDATLIFQYDEFYLSKDLNEVFPSILKILLYLIQEYGMLGAKTSMGYGVARFKTADNELSIKDGNWKNFTNYLALFDNKFNPEQINDTERKRKIENNLKNLPNLKDMFFVKFKIDGEFKEILENIKQFYNPENKISEDFNWLITSPVVRKVIRKEIKSQFNSNNDLRHFLMGKVKGKNSTFSAIQVSHVYTNNKKFEFRIYGWLPDKKPIQGKVKDVLNLLSQLFNDVPWKGIYDSRQKKKVSLLPSKVEDGVCWQNSNLKLLDSCKNVKNLFLQEGENQ
ncbi:type III-B CRISPR module RAMP protein Cmr1 [Desulfurobacterium atlanticum]|uniref:CRISPR-associated protein Cmr1 n=1 Tax=Desulfurobacterium atlanticum TaxID=240169 RepID=A0A239A2G4_9BACT|nr:type III-B CRISPR module RAMP protein Cmr1 [Desulfurobacterium atlanticum]SNR89491.1 CRISPR-associated protein Cmr1 [Desulfurobacterium atlanticum]